MAIIEKTKYYYDFIEYFHKAKRQQESSNLGLVPHLDSKIGDDLMENVKLYDVVERKYAGFSQIVNDCFYGWSDDHPYWEQMSLGLASDERKDVAKKWDGKRNKFGLEEWLYLFLLHRVTGSAIHYGKIPSGYHNTLLPFLSDCDTIEEMAEIVKTHTKPFYTSVGYQFPAFPKPPSGSSYKRGGDFYLSEYAPKLARDLARWVTSGEPKALREIGDWCLDWNTEHGLRRYKFQYAAFVADIADWFPQLAQRESPFYYGTNAIECISYLAKPTSRMKKEVFLDEVMNTIYEETGAFPYCGEDVACDYIRYVENYLKPGEHYEHLDRDTIWNSSSIDDHPRGRQYMMLELGLIDSFNNLNKHPSDYYILEQNGISAEEYQQRINQFRGHRS